jgi:hypothetical protein
VSKKLEFRKTLKTPLQLGQARIIKETIDIADLGCNVKSKGKSYLLHMLKQILNHGMQKRQISSYLSYPLETLIFVIA